MEGRTTGEKEDSRILCRCRTSALPLPLRCSSLLRCPCVTHGAVAAACAWVSASIPAMAASAAERRMVCGGRVGGVVCGV